MIDWEKELKILKEEYTQEKKEHLDFENKLARFASEFDLEVFQKKLQELGSLELELRSGNFLKRNKHLESEFQKLGKRLESLEQATKTQNKNSLKKEIYEEFKSIRTWIGKDQEEMNNKLDNLTRKLASQVTEWHVKHGENVKYEALKAYSDILKHQEDIKNHIKVLERKYDLINDRLVFSTEDLIKRQLETKTELSEKLKNTEISPQTPTHDNRIENIVKLQHDLEKQVSKLDLRLGEEATNMYKIFEERLKDELNKIQLQSRRDLTQNEMEEIKIVDEKLHEFNQKLNRVSDIVISHNKYIQDIRASLEARIQELAYDLQRIMNLKPIIVD